MVNDPKEWNRKMYEIETNQNKAFLNILLIPYI